MGQSEKRGPVAQVLRVGCYGDRGSRTAGPTPWFLRRSPWQCHIRPCWDSTDLPRTEGQQVIPRYGRRKAPKPETISLMLVAKPLRGSSPSLESTAFPVPGQEPLHHMTIFFSV